MEFKTVDEIIDYVNKETDYQAISKEELEKLNSKKVPEIYTQEGRDKLKEKGYFDRRLIWGRIGMIFNGFRCEGCLNPKAVCKRCRAIRTIIKSL